MFHIETQYEKDKETVESNNQADLSYIPTQTRSPIKGERVTCRGLTLSNSLGRIKLTNSLGKFGLARDHVVHLETAGNLCTSRPDVKKLLKKDNVSHERRHSLFKKLNLESQKPRENDRTEKERSNSNLGISQEEIHYNFQFNLWR